MKVNCGQEDVLNSPSVFLLTELSNVETFMNMSLMCSPVSSGGSFRDPWRSLSGAGRP